MIHQMKVLNNINKIETMNFFLNKLINLSALKLKIIIIIMNTTYVLKISKATNISKNKLIDMFPKIQQQSLKLLMMIYQKLISSCPISKNNYNPQLENLRLMCLQIISHTQCLYFIISQRHNSKEIGVYLNSILLHRVLEVKDINKPVKSQKRTKMIVRKLKTQSLNHSNQMLKKTL